jgi:hypothetical protein
VLTKAPSGFGKAENALKNAEVHIIEACDAGFPGTRRKASTGIKFINLIAFIGSGHSIVRYLHLQLSNSNLSYGKARRQAVFTRLPLAEIASSTLYALRCLRRSLPLML